MATVEAKEWDDFLKWFDDQWEPGKHLALIGPTGEGKSNLAGHVLKLRKWVMALDPKGGDETLSSTGFERVTSIPPEGWGFGWGLGNWKSYKQWSNIYDRIAQDQPARLIAGHEVRNRRDREHLRSLLERATQVVQSDRGWTIYVDEFQLLADRRMFGLDKEVEALLIAARSAGTSVVTAFQAPAWVPKAGTRQAAFTIVWSTRDRTMIKTVAEAMGRAWHDLEDLIDLLPEFHVLVIPKRIRDPMVLTHPPKL